MRLELFLFIIGLLMLIFASIVLCIIIKNITKTVYGIIVTVILFIGGAALMLVVLFSFRDSITSDYRSVDNLNTYQVCDVSFENDTTVVYYLDTNNEIRHVKSDKAKIFYDLSEDEKPYAVRNEYWRWFIYWDELEVHLKE